MRNLTVRQIANRLGFLMACIMLGPVLLVASACAPGGALKPPGDTGEGSPAQRLADTWVEVPNRLRPLRACFLAAGAVEVLTARTMFTAPDRAFAVLGHIETLTAIVARSKTDDEYWPNTELAYVAIGFARVFEKSGRAVVLDYLARGLSVDAFVVLAERLAVDAALVPALVRDIRTTLAAVEAGDVPDREAWEACEARIAANRSRLRIIAGAA